MLVDACDMVLSLSLDNWLLTTSCLGEVAGSGCVSKVTSLIGSECIMSVTIAPELISGSICWRPTTNQENETVSGFRAALSSYERPDLTGWNCYSLKCLNYCHAAKSEQKLLQQPAELS